MYGHYGRDEDDRQQESPAGEIGRGSHEIAGGLRSALWEPAAAGLGRSYCFTIFLTHRAGPAWSSIM